MKSQSPKLVSRLIVAVVFCLTACHSKPQFGPGSEKMTHSVAVRSVELPNRDGSALSTLAFDGSGEYLAVRSKRNTITVWQWRRKTIAATLSLPAGASDSLSSTALSFSSKGDMLLSCHTPADDLSSVTVWNTKTWKVIKAITTEKMGGGCTAAGFSADGDYLVRLTQKSRPQPGNTIEVFRTDTWETVAGVRESPPLR